MVESERLRVLPVVKAYPEPSKKYGTTVCVAAVTLPEGRWVRLYPIRFTHYSDARRFKKYQIFEADAVKAEHDARPESYRIDEDSIELVADKPVGTGDGWSERKRYLANAHDPSLCELQRLRKARGKSLGMVRVRAVTDFDTVEADEEKYEQASRKYEYAATPDLFDDTTLKITALPFKYRYSFRCMDPSCKGHQCSIIDWEAYELHRKMVRDHGEGAAIEKVRQKYVDDLCGADKESYFFMGNMARHPDSFLVLGVFYPKLGVSPTLFEFPETDAATRTEVPVKPAAPESEQRLFSEQ